MKGSTLNSLGFTLVELLVVIAMLMLLAGAVTSSVASAQRRAKIAKATSEAQEMTNAILAYEHAGGSMQPLNKVPATEANLAFLLGEGKADGQSLGVLFNASIKNGSFLDPWGHPYYVTVKVGRAIRPETDSSDNLESYVAFPNFNRRPADN